LEIVLTELPPALAEAASNTAAAPSAASAKPPANIHRVIDRVMVHLVRRLA
jgi:hypothetical protein